VAIRSFTPAALASLNASSASSGTTWPEASTRLFLAMIEMMSFTSGSSWPFLDTATNGRVGFLDSLTSFSVSPAGSQTTFPGFGWPPMLAMYSTPATLLPPLDRFRTNPP
jgi:hypothetical protein